MQGRLFEIVYILLNRRSITAGELAERFGISQRTIYRDIDVLTLAGIPVYTEKGKGGGISLLPEFVLNKSVLSEKEQNDILSALQSLAVIKVANTENVLNKLSAIFNKTTANWLEVDFTNWGLGGGETFGLLKGAILDKHIVEFDYYSSYGEKTKRKVEPLQLWFKSRTWYIKGYCLMRCNVRLFKLTRLKNLVVVDEKFTPRNLLAEQKPPQDIHERPDVTLKLKIAAEAAYRVYDEFDDSVTERQPDGSFIVTVIFPEDDWVYGTILSFGELIEVLEPQHIREIIKEKAQKITKKYL